MPTDDPQSAAALRRIIDEEKAALTSKFTLLEKYREIIPLLLDAGAKVDLKNEKGETALDLAKSMQPGGPRPMSPDLTAQDFVKMLERAKKE